MNESYGIEPTVAFLEEAFVCPKHGEGVSEITITQDFGHRRDSFCLTCLVEALDKCGVQRVTRKESA